jgi:hypothetical protein
MGDSETIAVGGRTIVTWLTPYVEAWEAHVGAMGYTRLAASLAPARKLLGDARCQAAFLSYCQSRETRKDPAYFAKDCVRWAKVAEAQEPVVGPHGTLTEYGKRLYAGQ